VPDRTGRLAIGAFRRSRRHPVNPLGVGGFRASWPSFSRRLPGATHRAMWERRRTQVDAVLAEFDNRCPRSLLTKGVVSHLY
jgi:hypothetical protein